MHNKLWAAICNLCFPSKAALSFFFPWHFFLRWHTWWPFPSSKVILSKRGTLIQRLMRGWTCEPSDPAHWLFVASTALSCTSAWEQRSLHKIYWNYMFSNQDNIPLCIAGMLYALSESGRPPTRDSISFSSPKFQGVPTPHHMPIL